MSAGRTNRPWQGSLEPAAFTRPAEYDPGCYLCPGNQRANGERNPAYEHTYTFTNDFAALRPSTSQAKWVGGDGLLRAEGERGTCRVLCYSPRHDLTLGQMDPRCARSIIDAWAIQSEELGKNWRWVQAFENRGDAMGASNPHPHGQIWAGSSLPPEPAREHDNQRAYFASNGRRLLADVVRLEMDGPRVVELSTHWLVLVPFWAIWPFETLVVPTGPVARLGELNDVQRDDLATVLTRLIRRYDSLFNAPFPYSMGWHGAPFQTDAACDAWQLHAHFYPPLLRSATIRKFMVGYELLAGAQRDILPEVAAARLRAADQVNFVPAITCA